MFQVILVVRRHGTAGADVSGSRSRLNALIMIRDGPVPPSRFPAVSAPVPIPVRVLNQSSFANAPP